MAKVFEKMASLSGFSTADLDEFLAIGPELESAEVGAVLGYLLGRLDGRDACSLVSALRSRHAQHDFRGFSAGPTVNIVGTGGGPSTFNITTTACFVVAVAGAVVVKTGSVACRSAAGYADVAAKLGTMKVSMSWEQIESIAADVGIVFVPPSSHALVLGSLTQNLTPAAYRNAALYLNKVGPLVSPVCVDHRFFGANATSCVEMLAGACRELGELPTTVVAADDGLDEVSTMAPTRLVHLSANGGREDVMIDPASLGIRPPARAELRGFEPVAAAQCCQRILSGEGEPAQMEIVALNAGTVMSCIGLCPDVTSGYRDAMKILKSGEALQKLHDLRHRVWECVKH
jgi:anthranilate phosphoribosyltransferase